MQLLCRSSHSEKVWRSSFSKNKAILEKLQHMREEKSLFEKKNKKQIRLGITFNLNYFPRELSSPW